MERTDPLELDASFLAVDKLVLDELDDPETTTELLDLYEEEWQASLKKLKSLAEELTPENSASQFKVIWLQLHKLKGSSLSLGLVGVSNFIESVRAGKVEPAQAHLWFPAKLLALEEAVKRGVTEIQKGH